MKSLPFIIGIVVAVLLIAAGINYIISHFDLSVPARTEPTQQQAPTATEPPAEQPTPTEQPVPARKSEAPVEQPPLSFEQKIENLRKAIAEVCATGESKEVTMVFTEAEANDQAAKLLTQTEMPEELPLEIKNVYIDFQAGNNVLTEVETATSGLTVTIKVKAQVGIEEGKPAVEVTDVSLGLLPLPESLKDEIAGLARQKTEDLLDQLTEAELGDNGKVDLEYTDINVQEEKVAITVIIKPRA